MLSQLKHPRLRPASLATGHRPLATPVLRGFTFIEVLFAIIILGVGLIMIAGMLPVAIQQGQKSQEDLNGRVVCDNGYALLRKSIEGFSTRTPAQDPFNGFAPRSSPSGTPFMEYGHANGAVFQETLNDRVNRTDPRFAWVPFVQRNTNRINMVMIGITRRESEVKSNYLAVTDGVDTQPYFAGDLSGPPSFLHNGPATGRATIIDGEDSANRSSVGIPASESIANDYIVLGDEPSLHVAGAKPGESRAPISEVAAEGAFVIIAGFTAEKASLTPADISRNTGRVFKLGSNVTGNIWRLDPAYDLPAFAGGTVDTTLFALGNERPVVWIVGRGLRNPAASYGSGGNAPMGPAQDVAIERYSFTIR